MRFDAAPYREMAVRCGLSQSGELEERFIEGMRRGKGRLSLDRAQYDALQLQLETFEFGQVRGRNEIGTHFFYLTKAPLAPLRVPAHPRAAVVQGLFRNKLKLGLSVFSRTGYEGLERTGKGAFQRFAKRFEASHFPFSYCANGGPEAINYLALPDGFGHAPVAFMASQRDNAGLADGGGELIFGEEAERLRRQVETAHRVNMENGRGWEAVLNMR